jgi:hypothetical protein
MNQTDLLDYHIEYPRNETDGNENKALGRPIPIWPVPGFENKDLDEPTKEIVVVVLGWSGSQHKHLAKYSDIYLNRG